MTVDVILTAAEVTSDRVAGGEVAVIDVFRATSVIVEAVNNGARAVVPAVTVEEAFEVRDRLAEQGAEVILGGERNAVIVSGFDKGNSPRDYGRGEVEGRTIVFTTTNGTRAIRNAHSAGRTYIASFFNMSAVARQMAAGGGDVMLICSGRSDRFTAEDALCAGAMVDVLVREYGYAVTDIADLLRREYLRSEADLKGRLSTTIHYNYMMGLGLERDIDYCLQRDIYDVLPRFEGGQIRVDKKI